jgi:hypothetical protein
VEQPTGTSRCWSVQLTVYTWHLSSADRGFSPTGKYTYLERSFDESDTEEDIAGPSSGPSPKKARMDDVPAPVSQLPKATQSLMRVSLSLPLSFWFTYGEAHGCSTYPHRWSSTSRR